MVIPMRHMLKTAVISSLLLASSVVTAEGPPVYQVTITNLTNAISFTPILVASHKKGVSIFELGSSASMDLIEIAEAGDTSSLATTLANNPDVADVQKSEGLLGPGDYVTVDVSSTDGARYISVVSMMLPTNDGFVSVNSVKAPRHGAATYFSPGYDAGTETNDEDCDYIPGPTCEEVGEGAGPSPEDDGEGYVHIHRGIHGIGNLDADVYDWRNPVAKISITRKKVSLEEETP
jgi:hypothetical protein